MDHSERIKEEVRNLKALLAAEHAKPATQQNKRQIEIWENQLAGLQGQLRHVERFFVHNQTKHPQLPCKSWRTHQSR